MLVDDDPVVGKSFNRVLSGKGYVVVTAHDGPEALKRLAEGDYETVSNDPEVREAYMGTGHA